MYSSQVFQRVPAVTTLESEDDARFAYFRDVILSPLLVSNKFYVYVPHEFYFECYYISLYLISNLAPVSAEDSDSDSVVSALC